MGYNMENHWIGPFENTKVTFEDSESAEDL